MPINKLTPLKLNTPMLSRAKYWFTYMISTSNAPFRLDDFLRGKKGEDSIPIGNIPSNAFVTKDSNAHKRKGIFPADFIGKSVEKETLVPPLFFLFPVTNKKNKFCRG
jgi:hypothetical protein